MSKELSPDTHQDLYSKTVFGFWVYILTDFVLFAVLFASYAVLEHQIFAGPSSKDLFNIDRALYQTILLLISSYTIGLAGACVHRKDSKKTILFFLITFLLGVAFFWMQVQEFISFSSAGNGWDQSAFLSAYFTLVGTHIVHIFFGLLWFIVLLAPVFLQGITANAIRRLTCLRMFWQFLNIIWVFIFTFVYLMGVD